MTPTLAPGSPVEIIGLWVSALLTLAVLSYAVRDNPICRAAQYLFVGITVGYGAALAWNQVLAPRIALVLRTPATAWPQALMLALGALLLARGWAPLSRLASLPLAVLLGVAAAVAVGGALRGTLVPQIAASMVSVAPVDYGGGLRGWAVALDAAFVVLCTLAVFAAYAYRAPSQGAPSPWQRLVLATGKVGRALMLVVLAALVAGAALSFFSALRGQFDFLVFDWLGRLFGWGG